MNDLQKYFETNTGRIIHKWSHYFEIYDRHFRNFRGKDIVILEIGVFQGGSLQMWKNYFGSKAKIYGIDIDPKCKSYEEENIEIFIGSQSDKKFLSEIKRKLPTIDILIDDGGHTMNQMNTSFIELFDHVKEEGVYLIEDLHTSYWPMYGGGYKRIGTFIERSKTLIDSINARHSKQIFFKQDKYTNSINSIHYYDSIIVIEKRKYLNNKSIFTGISNIDPFAPIKNSTYTKIKLRINLIFSKLLAFFRLPNIQKI